MAPSFVNEKDSLKAFWTDFFDGWIDEESNGIAEGLREVAG